MYRLTFIGNVIQKVKHIGLKNAVIYFIFQRILRINSHVPWPVHWGSVVSYPENIKYDYNRWGTYPGFMPGCYVQAMNGIEIGENVRMGPGVKILSANHNIYNYSLHDPSLPIIIGNNCWLSANSIILPGVKLGDHTIVAAGAVVTKSFPEGNSILIGIPARKKQDIDDYSS